MVRYISNFFFFCHFEWLRYSHLNFVYSSHTGQVLQDSVLNFICDAYHDKSGNWVVPESLKMKKELSSRREESELKSYRTKNRYSLRTLNDFSYC